MKLINVFPIISRYYGTLKKDRTDIVSSLIVLLAFPLLFSTIAFIEPFDSDNASIVVSALAILFGFTFNSLIIMARYSSSGDKREKRAVEVTRTSTLYALLVSLLCLISTATVALFTIEIGLISSFSQTIFSMILYFLLAHYTVTLFILIRRLYILVEAGAFQDQGLSEEEIETILRVADNLDDNDAGAANIGADD